MIFRELGEYLKRRKLSPIYSYERENFVQFSGPVVSASPAEKSRVDSDLGSVIGDPSGKIRSCARDSLFVFGSGIFTQGLLAKFLFDGNWFFGFDDGLSYDHLYHGWPSVYLPGFVEKALHSLLHQ